MYRDAVALRKPETEIIEEKPFPITTNKSRRIIRLRHKGLNERIGFLIFFLPGVALSYMVNPIFQDAITSMLYLWLCSAGLFLIKPVYAVILPLSVALMLIIICESGITFTMTLPSNLFTQENAVGERKEVR